MGWALLCVFFLNFLNFCCGLCNWVCTYMMFHAAQGQGLSKNQCSLLAVVCGKVSVSDKKQKLKQVVSVSDNKPRYPFPDLAYSGRLQVYNFMHSSKFPVSDNGFFFLFFKKKKQNCVCVCVFLTSLLKIHMPKLLN